VLPSDELDEAYVSFQIRVNIWFENITSSTKPEVRNVLRCRQTGTDPRRQVTRTGNLVEFRRADFEMCKQTERQTDKHTYTLMAILRTPIWGEVII